jgi:two-component system chemotaxis response regulator CheB
MENRNIVVIGASAGGFDAIKKLIAQLPEDFHASVFIVWHMSADVRGILPQMLNRVSKLHAAHAVNMEAVKPGRIYVAPPDHHMLLDHGMVRITKGPKENRFRPAIDPLFRSAAFHYGNRVIGIILSGALDDGVAGLWMIKQYGGLAIVQDPSEAEVPSMPLHALESVNVDYVATVDNMTPLLSKLVAEPVPEGNGKRKEQEERTQLEIGVAMEEEPGFRIQQFGELTPYTCPECHGVLLALKEGNHVRFRCHTGHAFSSDSLLSAITESIEESLWNTVRSIQESVMLLNHMGDHFAENNHPKLAAMYFQKAKDAENRVRIVRSATLNHERLDTEQIKDEARNAPV